MEIGKQIKQIEAQILSYHQACLGAEAAGHHNISAFLNLKNAFENSLHDIEDSLPEEDEADILDKIYHACNTLTNTISFSVSNLEKATDCSYNQLIDNYQSHALSHTKSAFQEEVELLIRRYKAYQSELETVQQLCDNKSILALERHFLKTMGFRAVYPKALENLIAYMKETQASLGELKESLSSLEEAVAAEKFEAHFSELIEILKPPKRIIKSFLAIVKLSIEMEGSPEKINEKFVKNTKPWIDLIHIISNIQGSTRKLHDITKEKNADPKMIQLAESAYTYLSSYIGEIERTLLIIEDNFCYTKTLLKEVKHNPHLFEAVINKNKSIKLIEGKIEALHQSAKMMMVKKMTLHETPDSLDKRLDMKIHGYECYQNYLSLHTEEPYLNTLIDHLIEHEGKLTQPLVTLKKQYQHNKANNKQNLHEIIIDALQIEYKQISQQIPINKFEQFQQDIIDGYYFYKTRLLSNNHLNETAYAISALFDTKAVIDIIEKNIDIVSKNNTDDFLKLGVELIKIDATYKREDSLNHIGDTFINTLLSKRHHHSAYDIYHTLEQLKTEQKSSQPPIAIDNENTVLSQVAKVQHNILGKGEYKQAVEQSAQSLIDCLSYYFSKMTFKGLVDSPWQNTFLYALEDNTALQSCVALLNHLELYTIQSIIHPKIGQQPDYDAIERTYHFFMDLIAKVLEHNELNIALAIYKGLISTPISNLKCYIDRPALLAYSDLFDLNDEDTDVLAAQQKKAILPILQLQFKKYLEINLEDKNLPNLLIGIGQYTKFFFQYIDKNLTYQTAPTLLSGLYRANQVYMDESNLDSIQDFIEIESNLIEQSRQINVNFDTIPSIKNLNQHLTDFVQNGNISRFNNDIDTTDVLNYLVNTINETQHYDFDSCVNSLLLMDKINKDKDIDQKITTILTTFESNLAKLDINDIEDALIFELVLFNKATHENEHLKNIIRNSPSNDTKTCLDKINEKILSLPFNKKALNSPLFLSIYQHKNFISPKRVNLLNRILMALLKTTDETLITHEKNFATKAGQIIQDEALSLFPSSLNDNAAVIDTLNFINQNKPLKDTATYDSACNLIKANHDFFNADEINDYAKQLDSLETYINESRHYIAAFAQYHTLVKQIERLLSEISYIENKYKKVLNKALQAELFSIREAANTIYEASKQDSLQDYTSKLFVFIEKNQIHSNKIDNLNETLNALYLKIKKEHTLFNEEVFFSLHHIEHPAYQDLLLDYINEVTSESNTEYHHSKQLKLLKETLLQDKHDSINVCKTVIGLFEKEHLVTAAIYNNILNINASHDKTDYHIYLLCQYDQNTLLNLLKYLYLYLADAQQAAIRDFVLSSLTIDSTYKNFSSIPYSEFIDFINERSEDKNTLSSITEKMSEINAHDSLDENTDDPLTSMQAILLTSKSPETSILANDLEGFITKQLSEKSLHEISADNTLNWEHQLNDLTFAFVNFYYSHYNSQDRACILSQLMHLLTTALNEKTPLSSHLLAMIVSDNKIREDIFVYTPVAEAIDTLIQKYEQYAKLGKTVQQLVSQVNASGKETALNAAAHLYQRRHATIESQPVFQTDIAAFVSQYQAYLALHNIDKSLNRDSYLNFVINNVIPKINHNHPIFSIANYLKNSNEIKISHYNANTDDYQIFEGQAAKKIVFNYFLSFLLKSFNKVKDDYDAIQNLTNRYLDFLETLEACLIRSNIPFNRDIEKMYAFVLHPELIAMHKWITKRKREKNNVTIATNESSLEHKTLWLISSIIEKVSVIDKFNDNLGEQLPLEETLKIKNSQRTLIDLAFDIFDNLQTSVELTDAGQLPSFDTQEVITWSAQYKTLNSDINAVVAPLKQTQTVTPDEIVLEDVPGWKAALIFLKNLLTKSLNQTDESQGPAESSALEPDEAHFAEAEYAPHVTHSERQAMLLSNLNTLLEGQNDDEATIDVVSNATIQPFSTQYLINSFMKSFSWATSIIHIGHRLSTDPIQHNLLGYHVDIPLNYQVDLISIVLVTMDLMGKLAGPHGEFAHINADKIEHLVDLIDEINQKIQISFRKDMGIVEPAHYQETIAQFMAYVVSEKEQLVAQNLALHQSVIDQQTESAAVNPELNRFLRCNERLMYELTAADPTLLSYETILSPEVIDHSHQLSLEDAHELIDQLLADD